MSITKSDVTFIAEAINGIYVSLYLPTHVAGQETQQDPIRLKNLLTKIREQMTSLGRDSDAVDALLAPATHLLDDSEYEFWQHQGQGLALFIGESFFHTYRADFELPELALIGDRFHITPLLPVLHQVAPFLLLSLSQNEAKLYAASPSAITPISLDEMPGSLEEALQFDDPEKQLQFHSSGRQPQSARALTFHGQGVGTTDENDKDRVQRYCHQIDNALCDAVSTNAPPLVVAGVDSVQDIFRNLSKYPNLVASGIDGNPEVAKPEELRQEALTVLEPLTQSSLKAAWKTYEDLTGSDTITSNVEDILVAANRGQVDTLFLDPHQPQWGSYNPKTVEIERYEQAHPKTDDLLNLAAIAVLANGGQVYSRPMSPNTPAAAVLRYPLYADQETSEAIRS
ncbi:MAG: hypothetical protein AAF289_15255 [Cyanobacteria bacterium P01_A01_bin.135]